MRLALCLIATLLLGACGASNDANQSQAHEPLRQTSAAELRKIAPGMTDACIKAFQFGKADAKPIQTDWCFEMQKPQRWQGLWRNDFEGSRFCPGSAHECDHETKGDRIWLTFSKELPERKLHGSGGLYRLDVVGRRTVHRGPHGHLGMFDHELLVDRVIAMRELEPPTPQPTEAELMESMIAEEARGTFIPNAETKVRMQRYIEARRKQKERKQ